MERIVENKWLELENTTPEEFATDKFEIMGMFSRKLNSMAIESSMQEVRNTIRTYKDAEKDIICEDPRATWMLFPRDMIYAYNYCLVSEKPVYVVISNLGICYTTKDTYNWKEELKTYIENTEKGCVRGFYEYRNVRGKYYKACMKELTLEEITELIK